MSPLGGVTTVGLTALDDSTIRSIAGAIAFGGKAGVGLSFSWNKLGNDSESWIADSDVDASGAINLDATTDNSIDTVSAAIGASKGAMAGAGAVTINTIDNATRSWIAGTRGGDGVDSAAGIALLSTDSSRIYGLAGALGASTDKAGVGVAFTWNDVDNIVDARLKDDANVESTAGDVTVNAGSTTRIEAIAASGGSPARPAWPARVRWCRPPTPSRPASTRVRRRLPTAMCRSPRPTMSSFSASPATSPVAARSRSAPRPRC